MTARLIGRIASQAWAMQGDALETMLDIAAREPVDQNTLDGWKSAMARPNALATKPGDRLGNAPTARVRDGVAVIPVAGPLFRYANLMTDHSGATALSQFSQDLAIAQSDSRVKAILLEIDSPGGEMTGMAEAAAQIRAAAAVKPVTAFVEGLGASGAYQIASAATEIVVAPTALVGCLGVVMSSTDRRDAEARSGVRRHEIVSSQTPNKRPDIATDAGRANVQAVVDRLAVEFLADVASNRGMSTEALLAATNGGGLVVGSDAVAAGLADSVGGFEQTLGRLAAGTIPALRASTSPAPRAAMETPDMKIEKDDAATVQAALEAVAAPSAPVAAAAPAPAPAPDPVALERARCAGIQAAALPEFMPLAALAVASGWPVDQFTAAQAASTGAVEAARASASATAFRESLPAPVAGNGAADEAPADPEARARADWTADAKLRAEFPEVETFVAFRKAEAAGKVRVLSKRA